ncbi:MAG: zinc-dependent metalloprotease [Beutenbergiaceae bacterium]
MNAGTSHPFDWDATRHRAGVLAPPGPAVERRDAVALVDSLRRAAQQAPDVVARVTGLVDAADAASRRPAYVVDRPRWADANTTMFAELIGEQLPLPSSAIGARLAAEQLGALLALLATRVLGQFDPFTAQPDGPGRLLLVAPNILASQRQLGVPAQEFHLWVCLHEQTHAVQFSAAPWLAGHLRSKMTSVSESIARPDDRRLQDLLQALPQVVTRREVEATSSGPLLGAVLSDEDSQTLAEVLAVMALLEGHADVVMDEAGPAVIPSVASIRNGFEARRDSRSLLDLLLRRLLGLDAKLAQYRDGAAFVRGVTGRVGHDGLNAAWSDPQNLPQPAEIADPAAWVRRVHG